MDISFGYEKNLIICETNSLLKLLQNYLSSKGYSVQEISDLEVLPYDNFSPHPEVSAKRMNALNKIPKEGKIIYASTVPSLIQPLFDKGEINRFTYNFKVNQVIDRKILLDNLIQSGYSSENIVSKPSQFAIRGSVIDIFPINSSYPLRLDLEDNQLISLKLFEAESQRSLRSISSFSIKSSKGFVLDTESIKLFKKKWRERFDVDGEIFEEISSGNFIQGIEFYSSLFYEKKPTLNDYFHGFSVYMYGDVISEINNYWNLIDSRYAEFISDLDKPILKPNEVFNTKDELNLLIKNAEVLTILPKSNVINEHKEEVKQEKLYTQDKELDFYYEFKENEYVVHSNHGIAIYRGLKNINKTECFVLEYDDNDLLYVPVDTLNKITPFVGNTEIKIDSLKKTKWKEKKEKSRKKAFDVAAEILEAEAKRKLESSPKISVKTEEYKKFVEKFEFSETLDQSEAIKKVIFDLENSKPQDRLVCGEVGFGKTEVALRAAFLVASNEMQVCILAPTTILAKQHFQVFEDRFKDTPLKVCLLTREQTAKEKEKLYTQIKEGYFSVVIGTHALFNNNLDFSNLNLLIIDEEHKFGVRQKEKIRSIKSGINVISLSATPIPRTLNLALSRVRDISLISTPPPGRKNVKTMVSRYSKSLVNEAIQREFYRDGQVFYLINDIKKLKEKRDMLEKDFPKAKIGIAHGQLKSKDLASVMSCFVNKEINILLCTTIIESGIDIQNANTLIIENSEKYGLSQLHQIRGRVGRSEREAYAYMLTDQEKPLEKKAFERIEALKENDSLNAGFQLAMRDLEIRGAGEILGEKQSGSIDLVGLSLFSSMIEKSMSLLQGEDIKDISSFELDIGVYGFIPEQLIPQAEVRLGIYKEISKIIDIKQLSNHKESFMDRFGEVPLEVHCLYEISKLKIIATRLGIKELKFAKNQFNLIISENSHLVSEGSKLREIKISYEDIKSDKLTFIIAKLESLLPK